MGSTEGPHECLDSSASVSVCLFIFVLLTNYLSLILSALGQTWMCWDIVLTNRNFLPSLESNSKFSEEIICYLSASFQLHYLLSGPGDATTATGAMFVGGGDVHVGCHLLKSDLKPVPRTALPSVKYPNFLGTKNVLSWHG